MHDGLSHPAFTSRTVLRVLAITAALLFLGLISPASSQPSTPLGHSERRDLPPGLDPLDTELCRPEAPRGWRRGFSTGDSLPDGAPLSFQQTPAILRPDHTGTFGLDEFAVLGDVSTLTFERHDETAPAGVATEHWQRTRTTRVSGTGRIVSLFEPQWPAAVWGRRLRQSRHGFDRPYVFWGYVVLPVAVGDAGATLTTSRMSSAVKRPVYLRVGSTNLPPSVTRQIAPDVQYASHVVNLVVPGFGDSRASFGSYNFDLRAVARKFYQHFSDTYDSIAFIPQRSQITEYGAFHRNTKNLVEGIGKEIVDQSHQYGSEGRLQSVEVYSQGQFASNADSSHEIAHQWGDSFDWGVLAGITEAGWHPSSHTPLLYRGETLIGSVLAGSRRISRRATPSSSVASSAEFTVERTSGPMRFHPLQLYRMGRLRPDAVPDVLVFTNQSQFADSGRTPAPGAEVTGRTTRVTIEGIMAHHGPRRGPSPTVWRRATVVVSREALLSREEMDYWNFFAQRLADPNRTGVMSYDGYPSFDALTGYRVDLQTDIIPALAKPLIQELKVDHPDFGRRDWRGVVFDTPVPSYFSATTRTRLTGQVTGGNTHGVDSILVRFWKNNGTSDDALRFWGTVTAHGTFAVEIEPTDLQQGSYSLGVFLFWPGSGAQYPRGLLSPAVVAAS